MKTRILCFLLTFLTCAASHAGIYTWTDAQGHSHFGDRPPEGSAPKQLELEINTIQAPPAETTSGSATASRKVVIYTADWCGACRQAKAYFRRTGVAYREYDVEKSAKGRSDYRRLKGSGVPIILVDDRRMDGFSPERFDQLYRP